jgi:UDP-N-acetylmuramate dehydrogenase
MNRCDGALERLAEIPSVTVLERPPLSRYTRFGLGGEARLLAETSSPHAFMQLMEAARASGLEMAVMGGGTNLVAADAGFNGIVIRYTAHTVRAEGARLIADAGALLQDVVDFTIDRGLRGVDTFTGIPGWLGAAVYGNAGAYGHSIAERVRLVHYYDGEKICTMDNAGCRFRYRESVFKKRKDWVILSAELELDDADPVALRRSADEILRIRNEKYPPSMRCAGSIFKNLILAELPAAVRGQVPARVVREGKVPSAYFLEEAGAKGVALGGIRVATYHANLIYNEGGGTAAELCQVIGDLKTRVRERFGIELEEEVQYLGFSD